MILKWVLGKFSAKFFHFPKFFSSAKFSQNSAEIFPSTLKIHFYTNFPNLKLNSPKFDYCAVQALNWENIKFLCQYLKSKAFYESMNKPDKCPKFLFSSVWCQCSVRKYQVAWCWHNALQALLTTHIYIWICISTTSIVCSCSFFIHGISCLLSW